MRTLHSSIRTALVALVATAALAALACNQGREGDRCNPTLNSNGHDECGGGLVCNANIPLCPEAYCCPTESDGGVGKSSHPNCQPGCNGGAASICNAGQAGSAAACALACQNDQGALNNPSTQCASADGGSDASGDAPGDAPGDVSAEASSDAAKETGGDAAHDGGAD
jgi:hypothetical protein